MLLPNFGDPSLFVEFDTSEVEALQENESDKATRRKTYVSGGIMTVNEVRQEMNLRPSAVGRRPSESGGARAHERADHVEAAHRGHPVRPRWSEDGPRSRTAT